ncbi:2-hydroxyacid dehydrogenase [Bradyrhizobium sp.]|uniref:2-hydroxyacid dehydrogenase n=1 Tax=Bradyrhizobium sp. TaxID=376 RepID=UPI0039E55A45
MTSIAIVSRQDISGFLLAHLQRSLPDARISTWPDPGANDAEIAVCWQPLPGVLAAMPNLKLIHSIAAGVDNILSDPDLPDCPVCRIQDDRLAMAMAEYVVWSVLYFHRHFDRAIAHASEGAWMRYDQKAAGDVRVGILGLGTLGLAAANRLVPFGYRVSGWSRTAKSVEGVTVYAGDTALPDFLAATDVLVCMLPLTDATRGILDVARLGLLPEGAALVLCSRGEHLVPDDLVALVRSGHLRGAILDVFAQEPLPPDHPLWREPGILITPHMAGLAKPRVIAEQIAENVRRFEAGEELLNRVDVARGY